MAIRTIRLEDDPILRKVSKPIQEITPRIEVLLKDMDETMVESNGVGIAAPQVGVLKRAFIILDDEGKSKIYINPRIVSSSGADILNEGCLSVHSIQTALVIRPYEIEVVAYDENLNEFSEHLEDFVCREFCHEYDHLDGKLYIDRMLSDKVIDFYNSFNSEDYPMFSDFCFLTEEEKSQYDRVEIARFVIDEIINTYDVYDMPKEIVNKLEMYKSEDYLNMPEYEAYRLLIVQMADML